MSNPSGSLSAQEGAYASTRPPGSDDAVHLPSAAAVLSDEARRRRADRNSRVLVLDRTLQISLITMEPHAHLREHRARGQAVVHTLSGSLRVHKAGGAADLPAHHLMTLKTGVVHDVEALEDSVFLLTVACPGETVTEVSRAPLDWGEPW